MAKIVYLIFSYVSAIWGLTPSISSRVLTLWVIIDSFLLFLKEIVKESFFGCMSKNVLNVSDLAYAILCGLTSSITSLPRLLQNFLNLEVKFLFLLPTLLNGFQTEWLLLLLICQNKAQICSYVKGITQRYFIDIEKVRPYGLVLISVLKVGS